MGSAIKDLGDLFDEKSYQPLCLDSRIRRIKSGEIPIDLENAEYEKLYPIIKSTIDRITSLIEENAHHDQSFCHFYEFDLMYLVPLLPKDERRKYMKTRLR